MRLHLIAPFDRQLRADQPWLATASLARSFSALMQAQGFEVVEYSNGSDSAARTKVTILADGEYADLFPTGQGTTGMAGYAEFDRRLTSEVQSRAVTGDVVCYTLGGVHEDLSMALPLAHHVEIAVGYDRTPVADLLRVYPSRAWQHYQLGKHTHPLLMSAGDVGCVIPHWVSPQEFRFDDEDADEGYALFMGRMEPGKLGILQQLRDARPGFEWRIASHVAGEERRRLLARARVIVCPTGYVEPFGLVAVESGMCGTRVIVPDLGAYQETVDHARLGWRVRGGLTEWLAALDMAMESPCANRNEIRDDRVARYSPSVIGPMYADLFRSLRVAADRTSV